MKHNIHNILVLYTIITAERGNVDNMARILRNSKMNLLYYQYIINRAWRNNSVSHCWCLTLSVFSHFVPFSPHLMCLLVPRILVLVGADMNHLCTVPTAGICRSLISVQPPVWCPIIHWEASWLSPVACSDSTCHLSLCFRQTAVSW